MSQSTGNLSVCYLLGSVFASALYSVYVIAFGASVYFLSNVRGQRVKPNKILLAVSVMLFICVTVHWFMGIAYIYTAFVVHGDTANGAVAFFSGVSKLQIVQLYMVSLATALMDGALVYRMYIVWDRRWPLVIVPCACIVAYMTFAAILLQSSIQLSQSLSDPSRLLEALHEAKMLRKQVIIAFSLALAASSLTTVMIIVKILYKGRMMQRAGAVVHLLLESAAVCCACSVITVVTFLLNNNGTYFVIEISPVVVGLSYSAIIIRVGLGLAERGSSGSFPVPISRFSTGPPRFPSQSREHTHTNTLAISVDRETSVIRDDRRSGNGYSASPTRSDDPEIALELVDELNAKMQGDKLVHPWEASP